MSSRLIRKGQLLEPLSATGVCQEHLLSPFAVLFILVIYWRTSMQGKWNGIYGHCGHNWMISTWVMTWPDVGDKCTSGINISRNRSHRIAPRKVNSFT